MSDQSLKSKTIKGIIWSSIDKFAVLIIGFLVGLILARILMPSDYGLIAMLAIFLAVSNLLVESGFSSALIQKHTPSNDDYSTIFYFNILVGVFIYLILFFIAPLIASFYNVQELTLLTRVLSLNILINSLSIIPQTRLTIKLDFKTQAKVSVYAVIISGALGLWAAFQGYGVWALVIQILSASLVKTLLLNVFNKWIPDLVFSISSFKQMFRFSFHLLLAGLVKTIVDNIHSILIGKLFSSRDLGFYTVSKQYPDYLSSPIGSILRGVSFPVLVSLKNERETMILAFGRLLRVTGFIIIPLLTLFALLSDPFIQLILTEKWMPIVPLMQWMCFASLFVPLNSLNMNILKVIGGSDLILKVELIKLPITIGALLITIPISLKAVVIGHFVAMFIKFIISAYYPGKLFGFGAWRQIQGMKTVFISTVFMVAGVLVCTYFLTSDLSKILFGGLIGIGVFLLAAYLMKLEEIKDIKELIQSIAARKDNSSNN